MTTNAGMAQPRSSELHVRSSSTPAECTASKHGTVNAYKNHHCRCPLAVRAWSRYMKNYRLRRLRGQSAITDATGTRRRLRALMAIGWTCDDLGRHLGCTGSAVSQLTRRSSVLTATDAKVRDIYDRLSDTPGPSRYTITLARNEGWPPPLWWDDDTIDDPTHDARTQASAHLCTVDPVVVERLIAGQPPLHVTRAERVEAVRLLDFRGWTRSLICQQLAMSGGRVAQILDERVLPKKNNDADDTTDRQEASA